MTLISFPFLFFLLIFGSFYFILPKKIQWAVLLAGNLVFYTFSGWQFLIYILVCTFSTWYAALQIEKNEAKLKSALPEISEKEQKTALRNSYSRKKRRWITAALILTLGVWIVLKYGPFLLDNFAVIAKMPELKGTLKFIVPLGMSFYTFDAIGYMIDVSRGKYPAEKNFFKYLTFVSYFPHIIQGPFSRFDSLGKTLFAEHKFSYDRLCQGTSRILWGYFKKLIIADKLAVAVNEVFNNFDKYWGAQILFAVFLYGIQLYADFSGYMDIVSGISHILGITLEKNFQRPYFAVSVDEFWRRWHITLGRWFRDYLFYPISIGKHMQSLGKRVRSRFGPRLAKLTISFCSLFWVWSATGLWHGANWTFLIWGWLNMLIIFVSQILDPQYEKIRNFFHISLQNRLWRFCRILRTFCIISFLRIFSRTDTIQAAGYIIKKIISGFNRKLLLHPLTLFPTMQKQDIYIALIACIMFFITDILEEKGKWISIKGKTPFVISALIYIFIIYSIILFAGKSDNITANFIYANF